jgi:hypothetical protein
MELDAKINFKGLEKLIKEMSKQYQVKVGLLANHGGADEVSDNMDLAGLGALQEFGADIKITQKMAAYMHFKAEELGLPPSDKKGDGYIHIPARSWLQMPIASKEGVKAIRDAIKESIPDDDELTDYLIKNDSAFLRDIAEAVGANALLRIQQAFDSDGFGQWAANSPLTIAQKGSAKPLVDTGDFRRHVTYEVSNS